MWCFSPAGDECATLLLHIPVIKQISPDFLRHSRECPRVSCFLDSPPFDRHGIFFEFQTEEDAKKRIFEVSSTCTHQKKSRSVRSVQCCCLQFAVFAELAQEVGFFLSNLPK